MKLRDKGRCRGTSQSGLSVDALGVVVQVGFWFIFWLVQGRGPGHLQYSSALLCYSSGPNGCGGFHLQLRPGHNTCLPSLVCPLKSDPQVELSPLPLLYGIWAALDETPTVSRNLLPALLRGVIKSSPDHLFGLVEPIERSGLCLHSRLSSSQFILLIIFGSCSTSTTSFFHKCGHQQWRQ